MTMPACNVCHRDVQKSGAQSGAEETQQQKQLIPALHQSKAAGEPAIAAGQSAQALKGLDGAERINKGQRKQIYSFPGKKTAQETLPGQVTMQKCCAAYKKY